MSFHQPRIDAASSRTWHQFFGGIAPPYSSFANTKKQNALGGWPPEGVRGAREVGFHRPPSISMSGRIVRFEFAARKRAGVRVHAAITGM